jgi:hypothetical protein
MNQTWTDCISGLNKRIVLPMAPLEGCQRIRPIVVAQQARWMILTHMKSGSVDGFKWEDNRVATYPTEMSNIAAAIRKNIYHTLSAEVERTCATIATMCSQCDDSVHLALLGYDEAASVPAGKRMAEGQESPETKVSPPMQTRAQAKQASGAGGLRGVVGSGQTGYVCGKSSPSSKPGS